MATNADFSQLTERVNEAQAKIKAAACTSRDELQAQVEQAQTTAEQQAEEIKAEAAQPPYRGRHRLADYEGQLALAHHGAASEGRRQEGRG